MKQQTCVWAAGKGQKVILIEIFKSAEKASGLHDPLLEMIISRSTLAVRFP
jgi:hypothetical protein